jgi:signal transduction histidine kinase
MDGSDKINILIVDDLPEKLLVHQTILEELGLNLITALSGPEALKQVLQQEFAVILLDVHMPGMDGFETASLIRRRKHSAHTPIIFLTAFPDEVRLIEGYAHGAVDYILLPVVPDILRAKVKVFADLYRMHQQVKRQAEERVALAEERAKRTAAEEDSRRKDEFLAMLAHELRNPLAPIRNAVELLRQIDSPDRVLGPARDMIDRQLRQMTRLVDDLLDVSRITRGKIQLQLEPVDVSRVVANAVEASQPGIEGRKHEFILAIPAETIYVRADPARLSQILSNLLNNAAKYTAEGGRIWLTVEREGDETVFHVRDTGAGIPAQMLPRIFDLFTQGDQSLDRSQGGLGIGLTLVRRLVEMHNGTVGVFSQGPGRGSEFVVRLPIVGSGAPLRSTAGGKGTSEECEPGRKERIPEHSTGIKHRVLVVDDNIDAADSLAMLLRLYGHEVRTVHNGLAALEAASAFHPGIVLLDLGLPGMDGYEIARHLRKHADGYPFRLAAVTGYGQEKDLVRSRQAGFDQHLVKPIDPEKLLQFLDSSPSETDQQKSVAS